MNAASRAAQAPVQYDLLLDTVRQLVLTGQDPERARRILASSAPLDHLGADQLLSWASCAQIAGEHAAAQAAFARLHASHPGMEEGWLEHRDYLAALNDQTGLAALRAACRMQAPQFLGLFRDSPHMRAHEADVPDEPFAAMNREARLLALYMSIFRGREDCFARQWADKAEGKSGYTPVRQAMTERDLRDHLAGRRTYGIYLMQADGLTRLGVIDVDLRKDLRQTALDSAKRGEIRRELAFLLERLPSLAREQGLACIVEFSGSKGYHFWFPFDGPVEPGPVRAVMQAVVSRIAPDLSCFGLEVFPKQDSLSGKGLGNLVKLPLGMHRLSGKPSRFLPGDRGDAWRQLEKLEQVQINSVSVLSTATRSSPAPVIDHPGYALWKQDYPELGELSAACPLLAGVFALCREGRSLSVREERVLFGVVGFLNRRKVLLHALLGAQPEYNPHLVDYRLSRLRGTPLGCKKIHALLESSRDFCDFPQGAAYPHPLLFVDGWKDDRQEKSESVSCLQDALEQLQQSLDLVRRMLPS